MRHTIPIGSRGGITNPLPELFEYDRDKSRPLLKLTKSTVQTVESIAQRASDGESEFSVSDNADHDIGTVEYFEIRMVPPFKSRLYGYSEVGDEIEVLIEPQLFSSCTLTNGHTVCDTDNLCDSSTEGEMWVRSKS